ncbi:hypothetical protein G6O69_14930 [Pseudenhygromyxa sp. WMMC2535]|uniref:methylmalonyl-CoA mutase family protein n=1 Tax=Pseudenhygromyxa sp. WMMC2535 TaxID=2712867 RepID=UPI001594FDBA|nr:methylmalonyl-CoA mutase family protein [Pseudenhygromyxa sp. WMMC2535]NVB39136.1 hypothetical protein [Pseudenhygromyxa sp. WMMC2535]
MSEPKFPPVDRAKWQAKAERDLRGRPLASLTKRTLDDVAVPPLAMAEDVEELTLGAAPGRFPRLRGRTRLGAGVGAGWLSVQTLRHADPQAANAAGRADLQFGAHGLRFVLDGELQAGREPSSSPDGLVFDPHTQLDALLEGIDPFAHPIYFEAGLMAPELIDALELWLDEHEGEHSDSERSDASEGEDEQGPARGPARGGVIYDPVSALLRTGEIERGFEAALGEGVDAVLGTQRGLIGVSTAPWYNAGAGEAESLALALSTCAEILRRGAPLGLEPGDLAEGLTWTVAVGGRPFEAIASLRAARVLWSKFAAACGLGEDEQGLWIHATPTRRTQTRFGSWVNLLRGTAGSFAAAIGGADSVATAAFDGLCGPEDEQREGLGRGSALGRRLAINTQVLLREESHLGRVIDPAGGSWAVESLTDAIARAAWTRFRAIEGAGGLVAGLQSGALQARVGEQGEQLRRLAATRKRPITGVSTFPALDDRPPPEQGPNTTSAAGPDLHRAAPRLDNARIEAPLPRLRLAAPFEQLRAASDSWAASHDGQRPTVAAINLGKLAAHQARLDFAANLFKAGGLSVETLDEQGFAIGEGEDGGEGSGLAPSAAASERLAARGLGLAVICGHDRDYAHGLGALVSSLRAAGAKAVWIAGKPPAGELAAWGLDPALPPAFIHLGCDALAALDHALTSLGVTADATTTTEG